MISIWIIFAIQSLFISKPDHYNFGSPDHVYILPDTLREISGLTIIDDSTFVCIQDENGILFIYDLNRNRIREQYTFGPDGDYEAICRVGETIYILRSDGVLFEVENFNSTTNTVKKYKTGITSENNEGLCYDEAGNRLLIASKSGPGKDEKNVRHIYAFDLKKKKTEPDPIFEFDILELKRYAKENFTGLPVREKKSGDEVQFKFRPSAIHIHPVTGQLYILSAADHMLFIFNRQGKPLEMNLLNNKIYNKAEGISFFPNGDLLITNEGQEKQPTLLLIRYNP